MTPNAEAQILAALADLTNRVNDVAIRLARIEERTSVLADHETRIRAAEEAARLAGETAVQAKRVAEAQAVRIRTLEDNDRETGKFTWSDVFKVVGSLAALSVVLGAIVAVVRSVGG